MQHKKIEMRYSCNTLEVENIMPCLSWGQLSEAWKACR